MTMDTFKLYEKMIDESDSLLYVFDTETYELLYMNDYRNEKISINKEDYVGKKCYNVLFGFDTPCLFCKNKYLSEGKFYNWEHYNKKFDEHFSIRAKLIDIEGKKLGYSIVNLTTDSYVKRIKTERMLETEQTILECVRTLNADYEIQDAFDELLKIVTEYFDGDRTYMFEFDYEKGTISNTYEYAAEGVTKEIDNLQDIPIDVVDNWVKEFEEKGIFYISNLDEDTDKESMEYEILKAQNIDSLIAAPFLRSGKIIGFLGVDNPKKYFKSDHDLLVSVTYFVDNYLLKRATLEKLHRLSFRDDLTELFNRNKFNETVERFEKHSPEKLGVIYVDLNGLKQVNDTKGHVAGDVLLKNTAKLIKSIFGGNSYRIGGDEFVVIKENVLKEDFEADSVRLRKAFEKNGVEFSMGLIWEEKDVDIDAVLIEADKLMYVEKAEYYRNNKVDEVKLEKLAHTI